MAQKKVQAKAKKQRGRPVVYLMPESIPDRPENIARAILQLPPKKDWDYLKPGSGAKVER